MFTKLLPALVIVLASALSGTGSQAQPADCTAYPAPTATIPLQLDLNGLPGVPRGMGGSVYANVPTAPPGGTTCGPEAAPPPYEDTLAGEPGDLLHGPGPRHDLLRGGPRPRVLVETPNGAYPPPPP